MGKLFGTDGIRGRANTYPITPEMALKVGKAVAGYFTEHNAKVAPSGLRKTHCVSENPGIIIGKDTRVSGDMLEHALASGICAMGVDVRLVGVIPTPAVSFLARTMGADAGIVISASHNPYDDNGIKLFKGDGYKPSGRIENEIEALVLSDRLDSKPGKINTIGRVFHKPDAANVYIDFLKGNPSEKGSFEGLKVVLDCANGATHAIAPELFQALGARVQAIFVDPNGKNINDNCGSQHPETLARAVVENGADIGLAFDGDGDRLVPIDETGHILTGDQILAIYAGHMKSTGQLKNDLVVSTVMSNLGLGLALSQMEIRHETTRVGDRFVVEKMIASGAVVGGEDSGHIVFLNQHTTGDGILAAINLLEVMRQTGRSLSDLGKIVNLFPQKLINVKVSSKPSLDNTPEINDIINIVEKQLENKGRVLVRYSGTQPMCRVMVEGPTDAETERYCRQIADVVERVLNRSA